MIAAVYLDDSADLCFKKDVPGVCIVVAVGGGGVVCVREGGKGEWRQMYARAGVWVMPVGWREASGLIYLECNSLTVLMTSPIAGETSVA
jgi:hypothetical protein